MNETINDMSITCVLSLHHPPVSTEWEKKRNTGEGANAEAVIPTKHNIPPAIPTVRNPNCSVSGTASKLDKLHAKDSKLNIDDVSVEEAFMSVRKVLNKIPKPGPKMDTTA